MTSAFGGQRSIQLSYGCLHRFIAAKRLSGYLYLRVCLGTCQFLAKATSTLTFEHIPICAQVSICDRPELAFRILSGANLEPLSKGDTHYRKSLNRLLPGHRFRRCYHASGLPDQQTDEAQIYALCANIPVWL